MRTLCQKRLWWLTCWFVFHLIDGWIYWFILLKILNLFYVLAFSKCMYIFYLLCVCVYIFMFLFGGVHFFVLWSHGNLTSGRGLCGCGCGTWESEFCRSFNWYTTSVRSVRAAQYQFYFCRGFMDVLWTVALQLNMLTWKPPCFGWVTGSHVHIIVLLGRQG